MDRQLISDEMFDKMAASLKESQVPVAVEYRSQAVMHIKSQGDDVSMGWLDVALTKVGLTHYNILLEQEGLSRHMKYVNCGYYFTCELLAKKFGGCVSNSRYWILYNEPESYSQYGYKGGRLPTAKEIIEYLEELEM